jgi:DNA excision repair protein ERCC-2
MVSLFPYDQIRPMQDLLIESIDKAVKQGSNLVVHAPTGLGKTSASLAATLTNTIDTKKTIFFLTSMHTQHDLALETLRDIKKKHGVKVVSIDIIGKKHLCLQPGVNDLSNREFIEYCKTLREDGKCTYFSNLKKGENLSFNAKMAVDKLKEKSPASTNDALITGQTHDVCPYEISLIVGKESRVIVTDYFYLFNQGIRDGFLAKLGKELSDCVIIVDEAHNLPSRVKDSASLSITNIGLRRALSEALEFQSELIPKVINAILEQMQEYASARESEAYINVTDLIDTINMVYPLNKFLDLLNDKADIIREKQKSSYLGSLAAFIEAWIQEDDGFVRIFSKKQGFKEEILTLSYLCLDPGVVTKDVIAKAHSTIVMSGTLTPPSMYREILGMTNTEELVLQSPFPDNNRLNIIIPKTSTKFTSRNEAQYKEIATHISTIVNDVPGNSAVFFPSYYLRDEVYKYLKTVSKTMFLERQGLSKPEKEELLERFKSYKNSGAVLLGISSGSFAEGVDLPGDLLKCVIVVGLPLQVPDLETKALIRYYDNKFNKGWDYGYLYPGFNRTLQSAGRCIRSETDRGVIVFLDERYAWQNYMKCFPETWNVKTTVLYSSMIKRFFSEKT